MDLDDPSTYSQEDRTGAIHRILDLPRQGRAAWSLAEEVALPQTYRNCRSVLICGMGGSAIGGDLARSLVEGEGRVPIMVVRGYELPGFVGSDSLVILSSYSGTTEETLVAWDAALAAGARLIAITTGGTLAERAKQAGFPVVQFSYPARPREAIGYSLWLILGVLARLGYTGEQGFDGEATSTLLARMVQELGPDVPSERNPAKALATRLWGRIVVVYGGGLMAEVARRWKGQLNENAKSWAFFEQLPELNHNAVMGYRFPEEAAPGITVVMLSCASNHPRVRLREQITLELLARASIAAEPVQARGATPLEQVWSATYMGDFVSYYLALLNSVDPSESDAIDYLKARLAEVPAGAGS